MRPPPPRPRSRPSRPKEKSEKSSRNRPLKRKYLHLTRLLRMRIGTTGIEMTSTMVMTVRNRMVRGKTTAVSRLESRPSREATPLPYISSKWHERSHQAAR